VANGYSHSVLKKQGFQLIGSLDYDWHITLWWHPQLHLELALVELAGWVLLRATKHYRLISRGEDGELYARDLAALDSYLSTHFEEVHFWSSSFRDITPKIASRRIQEKNFRYAPEEGNMAEDMGVQLQEISEDIFAAQADLQRSERLLKLDRDGSSLLQRYVPNQIVEKRRLLKELIARKKMLTQKLTVQDRLEKEYMSKGEAVCLLFTCCSNIQLAGSKADFVDVTQSVIKELQDVDKYQIKQKLQGGKLKIYVTDVDAPGISLLTRWVGAAPNPQQLANCGPEAAHLLEAIEQQLMVFPRKDIVLGGAVQDEKKLVNARVVRTFLSKLENIPCVPAKQAQGPKTRMPAWIGNVTDGLRTLPDPWELPLDRSKHIIITGKTGAGKSYLERVIVEGACIYKNLNIVVLDPRSQWSGILSAEDRQDILQRYPKFGLNPNQARSFAFDFYGIGVNLGKQLPANLRQLAKGRHVVSFIEVNDSIRCSRFSEIVDTLFDYYSCSESNVPRLLLVVSEAILFTRKGVIPETSTAAQSAERTLGRVCREGRKHGITALISTQRYTDYSHSTAAIRQNISTRIFMQNSDSDLVHAEDWLPDSKEILRLPTGQAFVCNPDWETVRIAVRPPLSKVRQLSEREIKNILGTSIPELSREAQSILDLAFQLLNQTGQPPKLTLVAEQIGITSRRRLKSIVEELKSLSVARFEELNERGKPLVIVPICDYRADGNRL